MHPNPHRRRTLIEQQLSLADANIVEIGALNGPTLSPKQYNIRFIDYADRKQLLKDTASNSAINPHDIVHVDYPVQDTKYSKIIQERIDLVIANHVIELKQYTSTHCHVFTADSFRLLLTEMKTLGYAPFDLVDFHDVDPGANEFHAMLRRS